MKKLGISKKIISTLVIVTIAIIIVTIVFLIKNNKKNKNSEYIEAMSYETGAEDLNTEDENSTDDTNEIMDIGDFENETIDEQEEQENQNSKTEQDKKANESEEDNSPKYYIKINNRANRVNVYGKDDNGNYTKLVRAMICSTGEYTPPCSLYKKTTYKMLGNRSKWAKFHTVYVRYPTRIVGGIFFHSVPYLTESKDGLGYNMFDKLGLAVSAGCIRLQVADAKWIYDNVSKGTTVEFNTNITNSATAPKISSNVNCRNWDPTDTDPNNPWKNPALASGNKEENKNNTNALNEKTSNSSSDTKSNTTTNKNSITNETKNQNISKNDVTDKNANTKTDSNEDKNTKANTDKDTNTDKKSKGSTATNKTTNTKSNGSTTTNKVTNEGKDSTVANTSKNQITKQMSNETTNTQTNSNKN